MRPRMVRSPVEICRGTSPSQAPKSRPRRKAEPSPMVATMALAMIGPLHCLSHGLGIAEVVLLALEEGLHKLPRHQLHVVAKREELTAQMMGADAGLHANQAWRDVGETNHDLTAGELPPQHDRSALV